MSTVEQSAEIDDPFRYFSGGQEGVQRRFGDIFRDKINRTPYGEVMRLCKDSEVDPQDVSRLTDGDYSVVRGRMIDRFSTGLKIGSLYEGFGRPVISSDEKSKLAEILGTSEESVWDLTLMINALRRLGSDR